MVRCSSTRSRTRSYAATTTYKWPARSWKRPPSERIRDLAARVDVAREEAQRSQYTEELMAAADTILSSARALRGIVRQLGEEDEE